MPADTSIFDGVADPVVEALAEAAGLGRAWAGHLAEVEEAIAGMAALRASFSRPSDPAAEPAPPYAAPGARRGGSGR